MASIKEQTLDSKGHLIHYDRVTISLHWLTFVLVILLFALAQIWGFLAHGTPLRKDLQSLHISLGIVLAAVIAIRLIWRAVVGRHLPEIVEGWTAWVAKAMHFILYVLLTTQIVMGFLYRWAQAETFMFFGLFPMQFATVKNKALDQTFGDIHNFIGWTIIVLVFFHATAALLHHYRYKDNVMRRMLPRAWTNQ
ncbi:MAG: cytochrome b [Herbaspirillum sp.]